MKFLWLVLLLALPNIANAGVDCSSGTWNGSTSCVGATHPLTYTITGTSTLSFSEFQAAYYDSCFGDTIQLQANKPMTLSSGSTGMLTKRTCGTGYITITTDQASKLPNDETGITPAYLPLLGILQKDPTNVSPITNYISSPWLALVGGKKQRSEHIKLVGLAFRISPLADRVNQTPALYTQKTSNAFIFSGKDQSGNAFNGSTGPGFFSSRGSETTLRSASAIGDGTVTPLQLTDVTDLEVGMTVAILPTSTALSDWCVIASIDVPNNNITCDRDMVYAHAAGHSVNQHITDAERDMANDIIVQHCLFINDNIAMTPYGMYMDGRTMLIRDNYFDGFRGINPTDARALLGSNGIGPTHILNNYMDAAGENMMQGATQPSGDWEFGKYETQNHMFNYFAKSPERYRQGPWDKVIGNTVTPGGPAGNYGIPRLVFRGRYIWPTGANPVTAKTFVSVNAGIACATEPVWASSYSVGDIETDCGGVQWMYVGINAPTWNTYVKNNYETKSGSNINLQYNVMDSYPDNQSWNGAQAAAVNLKANSAGCDNGPNDIGIDVVWPNCYRARNINNKILNNKIISYLGGINIGQANSRYATVQDIVIKNNFILQPEVGLTPNGGATSAAINIGVPKFDDKVTNLSITNNTIYNTLTPLSAAMYINNTNDTTGASFPGVNQVVGNIWSGWAYAYRNSSAGNDGGNTLKIFPCNGLDWKTDCPASSWDKNIISGAFASSTLSFKAGTVLNNCPTTSACPEPDAWDFIPNPNNTGFAINPPEKRGKLFRNRNIDYIRTGLHGLKMNKTHYWKRATVEGTDVGADPDRVPDIRNLTVTPTDRSVLFTWSLTAPIKDIPCVIEVWSGDPEPPNGYVPSVYAGELGDIGTYYRQDADDADRFVRNGANRMFVLGHTVNLSAATQYYNRVRCGGDVKHGTFTTLSTLTGTSSQTVSHYIQNLATANNMIVEYGTTYSRANDTISNGGTTSAVSCSNNSQCTVNFPANKGPVYYYRWKIRDASNVVIKTGRIYKSAVY